MVFVCLFADVYIVCVLSEGLLSGFFVVDFCVDIPGKHGATDQRRIKTGHLNWTRNSLPEAKRNHLAHGNYTGLEAFCEDLIRKL